MALGLCFGCKLAAFVLILDVDSSAARRRDAPAAARARESPGTAAYLDPAGQAGGPDGFRIQQHAAAHLCVTQAHDR